MDLADIIKSRLLLKAKIKLCSTIHGERSHIVLPFGLCNAPTTFEREILSIFSNLINEEFEVHMDDSTPYGNDFDQDLHNLKNILAQCISMGIFFSNEKCHMMVIEGVALGRFISVVGIQVDPVKNQGNY